MEELKKQIIGILEDASKTQADKQKEADKLEAVIAKGIYASDYVNSEIRPKITMLKREARDEAARAEDRANAMIDGWKEQVMARDVISPDDVVELADFKLLAANGIILNASDLAAIIGRAKQSGNRSLWQLAVRRADADGVELPKSCLYVGAEQQAREADSLREPVHLFLRNWVSSDLAATMLGRLF